MAKTWISCMFITIVFSQFSHTYTTWSVNNFMMAGQKASALFSKSAAAGGLMAVEECHHQFMWDQWNCPKESISLYSENHLPTAIREVAFLYSIISAGVMYTLTLNCSMGHFKTCSCDSSKSGSKGDKDWNWGGCSDNVVFGEKASKQYIDNLETGVDERAIVNLHNNEAGRRAVRRTLKLTCKCHGVSGSCSIRTCWKELPEFRTVGDYLKRKYFRAVMVDARNGQLRKGNSVQRRDERDILQISKQDLVYLEHSPNFCTANSDYGTSGAIGRACSRPSVRHSENRWERKSCNRLCKSCGLKVKQVSVSETSTCNCQFHWCCEVKCDNCTKIVEKFTCIPRSSST
ncbi:WNT8B [Bugula neritina]|uniref:Protein Wnt n=1 Tax=Bugula neritina TaxID=10212 RepID=A0A7J7J1M3_BUGNE|nr:WNT8B [Bugula neritina]